MTKLFLAAALLSWGCCKTCPPPKVVIQTNLQPCLSEPLTGLLPVSSPSYCEEGKPCTACLPGKLCYDLPNHVALRTNVERLLEWKKKVEDLCLKHVP